MDARYNYALWLRNHSLFEEEIQLYYQIERVIRQHYDEDPLMQVRVLRERANSFRASNTNDASGLSGLHDALDLLTDMNDASPLLLAEVLTAIGDWNVEFGRAGATGAEYARAWQLLGLVDDGEELRQRWFGDLHEVDISSLSRRGISVNPEDPEGFVVVYFTVDTMGRTRDLEITESEPPGFKDAAVIRLMRDARFRPRIIDGEVVPSRRAYRFEFRYLPQDLATD
jgi:TonB family protein